MADRALLKAARASRRVAHPNASYTSDGKLLCHLCELPVKTEAAWQAHLHSTQHTLRHSRAQDAAASRNTEPTGKKRKASSLDSPAPDERKKARSAMEEDEAPSIPQRAPSQQQDTIEDAEFAAFEREMAELQQAQSAEATLKAAATISAAPMTAQDVAAQAREEQSAQRGKRDVELEGEKEDALRLLEDEFEEMEVLEERVRRLRERREALRKANVAAEATGGDEDGDVEEGEDEDENEDDDGESDDDWNFGGR